MSPTLTSLLLLHVPQATHRHKGRGDVDMVYLEPVDRRAMSPEEALMDRM